MRRDPALARLATTGVAGTAATLDLGLRLAFWMFNRVPAVTTPRR